MYSDIVEKKKSMLAKAIASAVVCVVSVCLALLSAALWLALPSRYTPGSYPLLVRSILISGGAALMCGLLCALQLQKAARMPFVLPADDR